MQNSRDHWQEDTQKTARRMLMFFCIAIIAVLLAVTSWGLYVERVQHSRLIITCESFTSRADMLAFVKANPAYESRFDRTGNGVPCKGLK